MISLRKLSVFYLAAASSFALAIGFSEHPTWNVAAHDSARFAGEQGATAAAALNRYVVQPGWAATKVASVALFNQVANSFDRHDVDVAARKPHKPVAVAKAAPKTPAPEKKEQVIADIGPRESINNQPHALAPPSLRPPIVESKPNLPAPLPAAEPAPETRVAKASKPDFTLAPQATVPVAPKTVAEMAPPPPVDTHPPSGAALARVAAHFRQSLTKEMLDNFELFLFVSKADHGSAAQRMYVFQKQASGDLVMLYNWPVSTGREIVEMAPNGTLQPSYTPAGYYELDPKRMFIHHFSGQWHQPMPYAMFFNWEKNGYMTGLAIHGAHGDDVGLLGTRSSAGCVRLAPQNARVLFSLIKDNYKGLVPKFAYDKRTATMSNQGVLVHTPDGNLKMAEGYKVLVYIENYGGENVVAALF